MTLKKERDYYKNLCENSNNSNIDHNNNIINGIINRNINNFGVNNTEHSITKKKFKLESLSSHNINGMDKENSINLQLDLSLNNDKYNELKVDSHELIDTITKKRPFSRSISMKNHEKISPKIPLQSQSSSPPHQSIIILKNRQFTPLSPASQQIVKVSSNDSNNINTNTKTDEGDLLYGSNKFSSLNYLTNVIDITNSSTNDDGNKNSVNIDEMKTSDKDADTKESYSNNLDMILEAINHVENDNVNPNVDKKNDIDKTNEFFNGNTNPVVNNNNLENIILCKSDLNVFYNTPIGSKTGRFVCLNKQNYNEKVIDKSLYDKNHLSYTFNACNLYNDDTNKFNAFDINSTANIKCSDSYNYDRNMMGLVRVSSNYSEESEQDESD